MLSVDFISAVWPLSCTKMIFMNPGGCYCINICNDHVTSPTDFQPILEVNFLLWNTVKEAETQQTGFKLSKPLALKSTDSY